MKIRKNKIARCSKLLDKICLPTYFALGTIHFRGRQMLGDFDPSPFPSAVFYYYPLANLTNFEPSPSKK